MITMCIYTGISVHGNLSMHAVKYKTLISVTCTTRKWVN